MEYFTIILQAVLSGFLGMLTLIIGRKYDKIEKREEAAKAKRFEEEEERERLLKATRANLKFQIFRSWQYHTRNGFLPPEEIDIQNEMYEAYKDLGGNGAGELYHREMLKLPHVKPELD